MTPIVKNSVLNYNRGVRPITKNIIVVDEFGNEYTSTYAKRAKGLVKNGRARWLDGNTICLVCPPDTLNLEDNDMENRAENMNTINEVSEKEETKSVQQTVTTADILSRIDMIIAQGAELQSAVAQIQSLPVNDSPFGGNDGAQRAKAISNIYSSRETTNQKMIDLLNRMYSDIATKSAMDITREKTVERFANMNFAGVEPKTAEAILKFISDSLM